MLRIRFVYLFTSLSIKPMLHNHTAIENCKLLLRRLFHSFPVPSADFRLLSIETIDFFFSFFFLFEPAFKNKCNTMLHTLLVHSI